MRPSDENEQPPGDVSNQNAEEPSAPQADTGGMSRSDSEEQEQGKPKSKGHEGSSTEGSQATGQPSSAG